MTFRCRPRESGDPHAAARQWGTARVVMGPSLRGDDSGWPYYHISGIAPA